MKKIVLVLFMLLISINITFAESLDINQLTDAANRGDANAQYYLGLSYYLGEGVSKNYKQVVYWYQKAAEQGLAGAQFNLGMCYKLGEGVTQDYKQAVYWYQKAAGQGLPEAQWFLGISYNLGEGIIQDHKQAVYWYQKAAEQGLAEAQLSLANSYAFGQGITKNYKQAYMWLLLGFAQINNPEKSETARVLVNELEYKMTAAEIAEAEQMASEWLTNY